MRDKPTDYAGIDYSRGQANQDPATGIHYGVISQHSINPDALNDIYQNGDNLSHAASVAEAKNTNHGGTVQVLAAGTVPLT